MRRALFDVRFVRLSFRAIGTASRQDRRKLARARAAGEWRIFRERESERESGRDLDREQRVKA